MVRSFVMLLDRESDKIRMEATCGLNIDQARRVTYRVGEGVIGRVVQSGKPVVVPQTSQEPLLLNRLRAIDEGSSRREMSFICVPILIDNKAIGVIA
jgi:Nif-specific regulatory protein